MLCPAQLRKKPEVEPQIYATLFLQGILQVIPENKIQFRAFIGSLSTYLPTWLSFCLPACLPVCLLSAYHYPTIYLQHLIYIIDVAEQIVGIQRWIWHPLDVWHSSCLRSYCVTRMQVSLDMLNTVGLIKLFINWIFRKQWYQYLLKLENGGFRQTIIIIIIIIITMCKFHKMIKCTWQDLKRNKKVKKLKLQLLIYN